MNMSGAELPHIALKGARDLLIRRLIHRLVQTIVELKELFEKGLDWKSLPVARGRRDE